MGINKSDLKPVEVVARAIDISKQGDGDAKREKNRKACGGRKEIAHLVKTTDNSAATDTEARDAASDTMYLRTIRSSSGPWTPQTPTKGAQTTVDTPYGPEKAISHSLEHQIKKEIIPNLTSLKTPIPFPSIFSFPI